MPTDYILREFTSISFNIQLFLYECPVQQTDWICVSSATADEPLRPSRVECTACRHSLQHSMGFRLHLCGVLSYDGCDVQIPKFMRGCEAVTALLRKTSLWDVTLLRSVVLAISFWSSLSRTLLGLLDLEDGGSSLLRNAGNCSWHGQTSRQTAVFKEETVGTRDLEFPNERRKKRFTNEA